MGEGRDLIHWKQITTKTRSNIYKKDKALQVDMTSNCVEVFEEKHKGKRKNLNEDVI